MILASLTFGFAVSPELYESTRALVSSRGVGPSFRRAKTTQIVTDCDRYY